MIVTCDRGGLPALLPPTPPKGARWGPGRGALCGGAVRFPMPPALGKLLLPGY